MVGPSSREVREGGAVRMAATLMADGAGRGEDLGGHGHPSKGRLCVAESES